MAWLCRVAKRQGPTETNQASLHSRSENGNKDKDGTEVAILLGKHGVAGVGNRVLSEPSHIRNRLLD